MSREIKFRAWNLKEKIMQKVANIFFGLSCVELYDPDIEKDLSEIELMLYNPRYKVWQGDIVEVKTKRVSLGSNWYQAVSRYDGDCIARCVVEFNGNQFFFNWDTEYNRAILANRGKETESREFCQYDITNTSLWKIIGNVHDNPELLEK